MLSPAQVVFNRNADLVKKGKVSDLSIKQNNIKQNNFNKKTMKKIFAILGLFATLSVGAQTTIVLNDSTVCSGQSVTAIATATGYGTDTLNFAWLQNGISFGAANNDTITLAPGVGIWNYTVNITYGNQFIGIGFVTLTVNANPTGNASNTGPYCVGGTMSLQATGGTSYDWSGPNGFSFVGQNPTLPATIANAGIYSVDIYNPAGCFTTYTTNVVVNALPTPNITVSPNDTVCQGTLVALFATGGTSYLWNTNATTANITATPPVGNTTFTVQATDANGCQATANQIIVVRPNPVVSAIGINATCNGLNDGSAMVTAALGAPFTYTWNNGATTASIISLSPAVYTATVTNTFGCTASDTATVGQPALLTASITASTNVSCNGGSNGTATVTVTGGTGSYNYSWTGPGVGLNPRTNLPVGIYTVTVSDANGCSDTSIVNITQPLLLTANADSTSTTCFGDNNGTAFVSFINGGVAPYVYVWNNGQTGSSISNLPAGNYTATITDANGCAVTAATAVTQPSPVTFTFNQTNVTCNGGSNGSISVTANGGIAPYQYQLNGGNWGNSNTFSGLTAGNYTVSVKDTNQCVAGPTTVPIYQPNALVVTTGSTPQGCIPATGSAWAQVSGGQGPYSFQWSNSLGTNDSITTVAGTYTVTITDANNCPASGIAVIATPTYPIVGIGGTDPSCFGLSDGSVTTTVTGISPFTYLWNNGATTDSIAGLSANTYSVTVTSTNGCVGTGTFTLINPSYLSLTASANPTLCFGTATGYATALAMGGTGAYSFQWAPSGGTQSQANNLAAGPYSVTVTDANGCTNQASVVVASAPQLIVSSSVNHSQCAGNNTGAIDITVTGGTGLIQYWWTGPNGFTQISGDIVNLAPGNYNLTTTDANGCTTTVPPITVNGATQAITAYFNAVQNTCAGQSNGALTINASGGTPPFSYAWSNGVTTAINNNLLSDYYTVIITDAVGCSYGPIGEYVAEADAMDIIIPTELTYYCAGSGIPQGLDINGGTQPYSIHWIAPGPIDMGTSDQIEPLVSGIYTAVVIDGSACSQTVSIPITLVTCNTGVNELSDENVSIFPNPTSSGQQVTITLPSNINEVNIDVINNMGQSVLHAKTSGGNYSLNTSNLAVGIYQIQIASHSQAITKRLAVVK